MRKFSAILAALFVVAMPLRLKAQNLAVHKPATALNDCVTMELVGDGETTTKCDLLFTNPKTGMQTQAPVSTYCISPKTHRPPPTADEGKKKALTYTVAQAPSLQVVAIAETCKKLAGEHKYDELSLPQTSRAHTVAQLAIWKNCQQLSKKPEDQVTPAHVEREILRQAKVDPKSLSHAQKKEVDRRVDKIFEAVDLTLKESQALVEEQGPQLQDKIARAANLLRAPPLVQKASARDITVTQAVVLPAYTVLHPCEDEFQDMLITEDVPSDVPCDDGPPPVYVEDKPAHYCQGHKLVIIMGDLNSPVGAVPGSTLGAIRATYDWVKTLNDPSMHVLVVNDALTIQAHKNAGGPFQEPKPAPNPALAKKDQAKDLADRTLKGDLKANVQAWNCCCFFQEVVVFAHGGNTSPFAELARRLPFILGGKPIKKLVLWTCESADIIRPPTPTSTGDNPVRLHNSLLWTIRPQKCPCGCKTPDHCCAPRPIDGLCGGENSDCPAGEPVKFLAAGVFQKEDKNKKMKDYHAKLGANFPPNNPYNNALFTSPDGNMREIELAPENEDGEVKTTTRSVKDACLLGHKVGADQSPATDNGKPVSSIKTQSNTEVNSGKPVLGEAADKYPIKKYKPQPGDNYTNPPKGYELKEYAGPKYKDKCGCLPNEKT